jgi:hypothetical protein
MRRALYFFSLSLAASLLAASQAHAAGGGISNAEVDKGVLRLQAREVISSDNDNPNLDNRQRQRLSVDYGFNDWFAGGVYVQSNQRNHSNTRFDSLIFDGRFELTDFDEDGFSSGFRIRYTYHNGKPDTVHFRPLIAKRIDNWELRFNSIFYSNIGSGAHNGLGVELRTRASYEYSENHWAGLETFHDAGYFRDFSGYQDQSHDLGIVFTGDFTPEWSYETGYAHGISTAASDHTIKFFITRNF